MAKTIPKQTPPAASEPESGEPKAKGSVIDSRTFREGSIYLYKQADYAKPTWLCRVKMPGGKGYANRSTGTGDEHQAFKFADDLYNRLLVNSLTGVAPPSKRIGPVIDAYVRRLEPDKARQSIRYKILLMNRVKPTLNHRAFDELSTALMSKVIDDQITMTKKGSLSPTRSNESTAICGTS